MKRLVLLLSILVSSTAFSAEFTDRFNAEDIDVTKNEGQIISYPLYVRGCFF